MTTTEILLPLQDLRHVDSPWLEGKAEFSGEERAN